MKNRSLLLVGLLVCLGFLVACALAVAADDTAPPVVVVPEDVPGADVIIFRGDTYDFDMTECNDDEGIVLYKVEFKYGGADVSIENTTGHVYFKFDDYAQMWVTITAYDEAGNEGSGKFCLDVAEKITSDLDIIGVGDYVVDHSLYLDGGDLNIDGSTVSIAAGAGPGEGGGGGGTGKAPDMLGESLTPSAGELSGHWEPYYWYNYWRTGSATYGKTTFDTGTKMTGKGSILNSGATSSLRGFEYHFNTNVDLTAYNSLSFWIHSTYPSSTYQLYYTYFYGSHDYSSTYGYAYTYSGCYPYQGGGYAHYRGWAGFTIPLNLDLTGYNYKYNYNPSSVACIRIYMYSISTSYSRWIDNICLSKEDWGDVMTESPTPSGEYGGYWYNAQTGSQFGFSTKSPWVGKGSVTTQFPRSGTYYDLYYYFNKPTDLSGFAALRFFITMEDSIGQQCTYAYYWPYNGYYDLYAYDSSGRTCGYYAYTSKYTYYGNGYRWYAHSLPWGTQEAYSISSGFDMTKVSRVRLANIYMMYVNPGNYPITVFIDGFEWYGPDKSMGGGGGGAFNPDTAPLAIYVKGGDATITGGSRVVGTGATGARLMVDGGSATIQDATFDNMWFTQGTMASANALSSFGGLEVYGNANIENAAFVNCKGPGLALFDGMYTLDRDTIDLGGTTTELEGAPKVIIGVSGRANRPYTIDMTGWTLEGSPAGWGALVMARDCTSKVTLKVHDNSVDNNVGGGIAVSAANCECDVDIQVYSQPVQGSGRGILVGVTGPPSSTGWTVSIDVEDSTVGPCEKEGVVISADGVTSAMDIMVDGCTLTTNGDVGLLVALKDSLGGVDLALSDVLSNGNAKEGTLVKYEGMMGTTDIDVRDSTFRSNEGSGLSFTLVNVIAMTGTTLGMNFADTVLDSNGGLGLSVAIDGAVLEADVRMSIVESLKNTGDGIGLSIAKATGNLTVGLLDVDAHDNTGSGLYVKTSQEASNDMPSIATVGIDMDSCLFRYNTGSGVLEEHSHTAGASDEVRSGMRYIVTAWNVSASLNQGNGYEAGPSGSAQNGFRDASYSFRDSVFSTNKLAGFYIHDLYDNNLLQGYTRERFDLTNCTLSSNANGLEQYWERYSYGTETSVRMDKCTLKDNELQAVYAHGYESATSGESCLLAAIYEITACTMDSQVVLDISGAYDLNGLAEPTLNVTMVNNTYSTDDPVTISLSGYYNCLKNPVLANVVYKSNKHTLSSSSDGLRIEVLGGLKLQASVNVEKVEFTNPTGHAVSIVYGTTHNTATQRKLAIIMVEIADLKVRNSLLNAVDIDEQHANPTEAYTIGRYSITRLDVRDAETGVWSESVNGEVRDSKFSRMIESTITVNGGIIDVYDSDIGEVSQTNLVVDDRSAIRLWYSLLLKVVWSTTGDPVLGASLEVRDNTWSIIGVNIIEGSGGVLLSNLNSVTVDSLGIITRNPYIASIEFRGISKEVMVNVTKKTELTIALVDDIAPRLSIEMPRDGTMQQDHSIYVRGGAYDMHSGIDHVEATVDGETWYLATGRSIYECTIPDGPEGTNVLRVRAYDTSGNYKEASIIVVIDSTPPPLTIVSPPAGSRTRSCTIEVVGTTDVGASAFINGVQVPLDYTLISYLVTLVEGSNSIKVTVTDQLGNAREVIIDVFLDTQAPYLALLSPANGATLNMPTVFLMGQTETEAVTVWMGTRSIPTDQEGLFNLEVSLDPGINHIELVAVDDVGNERHLPVVLTYDNVPPWLKVVEPVADTIYITRDITVAGYVKEGTRVFVEGKEVDVVQGQFSTVISVPEGVVDLEVMAIDEAGNELSETVPIIVDLTPPGLEVTSPVDGLTTNERTLRVTGLITTLDNPKELGMTINGVAFPVGLDNSISQAIELVDGVNMLTIEVVDLGGNMMSVSRRVVLDSSAPYLTFGFENTRIDPFFTDPVSISTFVYVTGFTEVGASLTINGVFVEVDHVTGHFNHTLALPEPAVGYRVSRTSVLVVATDAAGNSVSQEGWVNRLEGEVKKTVEAAEDNGPLMMAFALIILVLSIAIVAAYRLYGSRDELVAPEEVRVDTTVELEATRGPPARPPKGGAKGGKGPDTGGDADLEDAEVD